jgi:hypothetical protein
MKSLEELKTERFTVLFAAYKGSGANPRKHGDLRAIAAKQGLALADFRKAYDYLKAEGLLRQVGTGYNCSITHRGICLVEEVWEQPDESVQGYPAFNEMDLSSF